MAALLELVNEDESEHGPVIANTQREANFWFGTLKADRMIQERGFSDGWVMGYYKYGDGTDDWIPQMRLHPDTRDAQRFWRSHKAAAKKVVRT